MKITSIPLVLLILAAAGCAHVTKINFDNYSSVLGPTGHPIAPQQQFRYKDVLVETNSQVKFVVLPFQWEGSPNPPPVWTKDGYVDVSPSGPGGMHALHFNNACVGIVTDPPKAIKKLVIGFVYSGGNNNLIINPTVGTKDPINFRDFASLPNPVSTNPTVTKNSLPAGAHKGDLVLSGPMNPFTFSFPTMPAVPNYTYSAVVGGGQELWIEALEFESSE